MSKQTERHNINDELYIFMQANSARWYVRFNLFGKWYVKATKKKIKDEAIAAAYLIFERSKIEYDVGTFSQKRRFKDLATMAIKKMEKGLEAGTGLANWNHYIAILKKYHIPFFERYIITNIDQEAIKKFDEWRIEELGKVPASSTLQNHNAAMQMVFREAIEQKWMHPNQVPLLSSKGEVGQRRAAFTDAEYDELIDKAYDFTQKSHTAKTRMIRELLPLYMDFAVYSGIRPGTELENLTWGDITPHIEDHKIVFYVSVRKGKTTKYTGTREVVCESDITYAIKFLREMFPQRKPEDRIFRLKDGSSTNQLGKAFEKLLEFSNLKESPAGIRTRYSLRHTYITWQLEKGHASIDVIAKNCGTSTSMIEQHYSHVMPRKFTRELSGVDIDNSERFVAINLSEDGKAIRKKEYEELATAYKNRGCI